MTSHSHPYGAPSDGVSTPPSGVGGIPIPHARSMSPSTFQSAFSPSAGMANSPSSSTTGGPSAPMARTVSEKEREREKERGLYPSRVIISSTCRKHKSPSAVQFGLFVFVCPLLIAYPDQSGIKPTTLQWGASEPHLRGPVVCSRLPSSLKLRNAIGAHSGSYSIYKALAVVMGESRIANS